LKNPENQTEFWINNTKFFFWKCWKQDILFEEDLNNKDSKQDFQDLPFKSSITFLHDFVLESLTSKEAQQIRAKTCHLKE
jgi:hypothetical protein